MAASLAIVTLNQKPYLRKCLDSISRYTDFDLVEDVIVVDNGSTDGTGESVASFIKEKGDLTNWRYHNTGANIGCSAGWNTGIRCTKGDPILVLNDDIIVSPNWLSNLLSFAKENPKALVSCHVLDHPDYGKLFEENDLEWGSQASAIMKREWDVSEIGMQGPAMCLSRELIEDVGLYDEGYKKVAYEDCDYVVRVTKKDRPSLIAHRSVVFHYGGTTQSYISRSEGSAHLVHNRAYFQRKWNVNLDNAICNRSIFWREGVRVL